MNDPSLTAFVHETRRAFGPLASDMVAAVRAQLAALAAAPADEPWLAALHREAPASRELHRDPEHGFVLLAHTEPAGLYRPPHDHGRAWVIYALQRGAIEIGTYARVAEPDGSVRLVRRDASVLRPGEARIYLPGDIHDTRCLGEPSLLFRFTSRDLKSDAEARAITRYVERDGAWTVGPT